MTLTISDDLPGNITDVEFADTMLPGAFIGQAVSGTLDRPIPHGDPIRRLQCHRRLNRSTLGAASATFADQTGNYRKSVRTP